MQYKLVIIVLIFAFIFLIYNKSVSFREGFVDVDKERFVNGQSNNIMELCTNFNSNCVGTGNSNCNNNSIVACQKYEIKCDNKCRNKKMDDDDKKEPDYNKCIKSCLKVKTDCCNRLNNI